MSDAIPCYKDDPELVAEWKKYLSETTNKGPDMPHDWQEAGSIGEVQRILSNRPQLGEDGFPDKNPFIPAKREERDQELEGFSNVVRFLSKCFQMETGAPTTVKDVRQIARDYAFDSFLKRGRIAALVYDQIG